jgi:transposase
MFMIGFDLGKRKSQLCVKDEKGKLLAEIRVDTNPISIADALRPFPGARVLIESSTSSEWVAHVLESIGCDVVVGDPRFGPMYAHRNKKIKTDKRDAEGLCTALTMGAFSPAHRKSQKARELQTMLLARNSIVHSRSRLINLVRAASEREGIRLGGCSGGDQFLDELVEHTFPMWLADSLAPAVTEIASLTEQIRLYDSDATRTAKRDVVAQNLMTVYGVGPLTALSFIATIDDPKRFTSATDVVAYLGLAPGQRNSGDSKRRPGAITKAGDPIVRAFLFEAAMSITRKSAKASSLKDWGLALKSRNQNAKKKAFVGVARRLARILWAMWRDGRPFDPKKTAPDLHTPATAEKAA